jgi:hypothetical protein
MATGMGKNSAKAGSNRVPKPKPENSVRPEASRDTVQRRKKSMGQN